MKSFNEYLLESIEKDINQWIRKNTKFQRTKSKGSDTTYEFERRGIKSILVVNTKTKDIKWSLYDGDQELRNKAPSETGSGFESLKKSLQSFN